MRFLPGILVIVLHIYCWIEIAQSDARQVRQLSKGVWFLISLVPVAGPVIWLIYGRPNGEAVSQPTPKPRPRVVAPDDDPDFLRSLRRPKPPTDDNPPH
jgi:Phospholipase_D-nuclease N-terminal